MKPERSSLLCAACTLCLTSVFLLFILCTSDLSTIISNQFSGTTSLISKPRTSDYKDCDLFTGQWVRDIRRSRYSNSTCPMLMIRHNCIMHGKDGDYMNWRWKPDQCELPRFEPETFLSTVRGKTMAFVGDSVARNQMGSLLCLLSQVATPINKYIDAAKTNQIWYFPSHNFTIKLIWSAWLVIGEERIKNAYVAHLHLDKVDPEWSKQLPGTEYAIISSTHWFERKLYLYNQGNLIGCVSCYEANVTKLDLSFAIQTAFQTALKSVSDCEQCKGLVTWVRTSSPSHFENGSWRGGRCNRTGPLSFSEVKDELKLGDSSWEIRKIQVEEIEKAKKNGEQRGVRIKLLDIANAMYMRPDAHPDIHWHSYKVNEYKDCLHWCLPGPIDAWNDLLLATI